MTAKEYFNGYAHEGRAFLAAVPRSNGRESVGRPAENGRCAWLIHLQQQLWLCHDAEFPVLRLVEDNEPILPHERGGYRL